MAHRLIWSKRAKADIQRIAKRIERDSRANAELVVTRLAHRVRRLPSFPLSGRIVPEWRQDTLREVIVYPYRVVYKVAADTIYVVTIIHSRRRFPQRPPRIQT